MRIPVGKDGKTVKAQVHPCRLPFPEFWVRPLYLTSKAHLPAVGLTGDCGRKDPGLLVGKRFKKLIR
jgi:hypothetical protein